MFSVYIQPNITELQESLLRDFFVRLHMVADLEVKPAIEADSTFGTFLHFLDVFLDVLQG
jgi:hypothetical protein